MMVRLWVYDDILASGVSGPIDVFAAANRLDTSKTGRFRWSIESLDGKPVRSASGQSIAVDRAIDGRTRSQAILLTAPFVLDMDAFLAHADDIAALTTALKRQHRAGALLASYCTGNYLLAEAGLLEGRETTTHWSKATDFAARYPRTKLRADRILTEQDGILCGGTVTSYLTLAIRLVAKLASPELAELTARTMLIDTGRVSQTPYARLVKERGHGDALVATAQRYMEDHLDDGLRLGDLAIHLAISERTLTRRFKQAMNMAPLEYLQTLRIEMAKTLLEEGRLTVDAICQRVGYVDISAFRVLFKRMAGCSPREYQQGFSRRIAGVGDT